MKGLGKNPDQTNSQIGSEIENVSVKNNVFCKLARKDKNQTKPLFNVYLSN